MESTSRKESKGKGKDKQTTTMKKEKLSCKNCKKEGNDDEHCWKLHPEM
jgi:hypothetical protein